jgi:hypothetical protein
VTLTYGVNEIKQRVGALEGFVKFSNYIFLIIIFFQVPLTAFADAVSQARFSEFVEFVKRQSQISDQFKQLISHPGYARKTLSSKTFQRFVENMGDRHLVESFDPHPTYRQELPKWSAESRELIETDLYFVRYANRLEMAMERVALVDSCHEALKFGTRPVAASPAARDFLTALLYRGWMETKSTGLPVQIIAKRLNSNITLNEALERVGFELKYPAREHFVFGVDGKVDWSKSLSAMAEKNLNITLQLDLR